MTTIVEIGGKRYERLSATSIAHDLWLMAKTREAGLDRIQVASMEPEDLEAGLDEVIDRVIVSGHALALLAGLMVPEGLKAEDWTPEVPKEIEASLSKITDATKKSQVKPLIASMLAGFFTSGLASLKTSRPSSETAGSAAKPEGEDESSESADQ